MVALATINAALGLIAMLIFGVPFAGQLAAQPRARRSDERA